MSYKSILSLYATGGPMEPGLGTQAYILVLEKDKEESFSIHHEVTVFSLTIAQRSSFQYPNGSKAH